MCLCVCLCCVFVFVIVFVFVSVLLVVCVFVFVVACLVVWSCARSWLHVRAHARALDLRFVGPINEHVFMSSTCIKKRLRPDWARCTPHHTTAQHTTAHYNTPSHTTPQDTTHSYNTPWVTIFLIGILIGLPSGSLYVLMMFVSCQMSRLLQRLGRRFVY